MISISEHFMEENANPWCSWDAEALPESPKEIEGFLQHEEKIVVDLIKKGLVTEECLPWHIANFMAVAFSFKYSEHLGLVDHVFFYSDTPTKINLGSMLGEVEIFDRDKQVENEANFANVGAMFSHGMTLIERGDEASAEVYLRKATNFQGDDDYDQILYAHDCLGALLANQGRMKEAVDIWTQGLIRYKSSEFISKLERVMSSEKDKSIQAKAFAALSAFRAGSL